MKLTPEQQAVLDGSKGEVMAKVMKTLVMYGDAFGAEKMVPITSIYGHTVISFGINAMKPVYDLYDQLIEAGAFSEQKFTADPLPLDKNVPSNPLQDLVFRKFMYKQQARYEEQLRKLGILSDKDYTCTCYLDEVGNKPKQGEVLSWAESSAVVYANSVLGARCNRNSGMIELMGSIAGCVPYFGFLTDDGRKADWIVEVRTTKKPEPQLLGSAIGMKVMEKVPYVKGLDKWLGMEINDDAIAYLKDFGAATASNGAVGLYHIEHLTPEAVQQGEALIRDGAPVYVIDDAELQRVRESYPCVWKNRSAKIDKHYLLPGHFCHFVRAGHERSAIAAFQATRHKHIDRDSRNQRGNKQQWNQRAKRSVRSGNRCAGECKGDEAADHESNTPPPPSQL